MPDRPPSSTDRELASLKQEFDDIRSSLGPLAKLDPSEQALLADLARARDSEKIDRRTLMQAAAALGIGGALGIGAAGYAVGEASAAASTGDSDGDIGLPGNRVDGFFDGVDATSISTEQLFTSSRPESATVWEDSGGTVYADGPGGVIDSGTDFANVLQNALNAVPQEGTVSVNPGSYSLSTEVSVPVFRTLWAPSTEFTIGGDHNGFFVDNHAQILGFPMVHVTASGYTSDAVVLDTSRATAGEYGFDSVRKPEHLDIHLENDNATGQGLALRATTGGISFVRGRISIHKFASPVRLHSANPGSFINGNYFDVHIDNGTNQIHHTGGQAAMSYFSGTIQTGVTATDRSVYNETGQYSVTFVGQLWDAGNVNITPIDGKWITVHLTGRLGGGSIRQNNAPTIASNESTVYEFYGDNLTMGNINSDDWWNQKPLTNGLVIQHATSSTGYTNQARFDSSGNLILGGSVTSNGSP